MVVVGERLRQLRIEHHYSQAQMAQMCGVSQATIGRYESGSVEPPLEKLLWYAETFEVSLDYIFGQTDDPKDITYRQNLERLLEAFANQ